MLEVKPETIEFFDEIGKLELIGIKALKGIFNKRAQRKNHVDAGSSPLFEACNLVDIDINDLLSSPCVDILEFESQIQTKYIMAQNAITDALNSSSNQTKEASPYLKVRIFLDVNETNISDVSRRIGVDRKYIRRFYNEGRELLKQKIND